MLLLSLHAVSVTGNAGVGLPVILLHDAEGSVCTVEVKSGDIYRGVLDEAEDNMNIMMKVSMALRYPCISALKYYRHSDQLSAFVLPTTVFRRSHWCPVALVLPRLAVLLHHLQALLCVARNPC